MFLRNVAWLSTDYSALRTAKIELIITTGARTSNPKMANVTSYPFITKIIFNYIYRINMINRRNNKNRGNDSNHDKVFFVNPFLFASCTNTFSKWCKITRGMKRSAQ
jgi:hypothetical protein